jgi:hypothetical protein
MIEIVSATRFVEQEFWNESALGRSLRRIAYDQRLAASVSYENRRGLPEIYNSRILALDSAECLVFVHDDVWIDDNFFVDRILSGLDEFDVIGVAGNRRRLPKQPAWAFRNAEFQWDDKENLSGSVGHGSGPWGDILHFGTLPSECELLDGVLLAAKKSTLLSGNVLFDTLFSFHFYDLDFSRTAKQAGLRLSTWPIAITHQSYGSFGTPVWQESLARYLAKWKD